MATAAVKFDILANDRASKTFDKVGRSANDAGGKFSRFGSLAKAGAMAAGAGILVAAGAAVKLVKAAAEDEASAKRMATSFHNSAGATQAQIKATEAWITAQGKAKGVADDQLRPALSTLVRSTHDVGKAQRLSSLAMDISADTGKDLGAVSMALAKANNGNVGALSRLGLKTKDAEGKTLSFKDAVKGLGKEFSGAASKHANTTAGKFERLKLIASELGESIGGKLLPYVSDFASFLLNKGVPAIEKMGGWIKANLWPAFQGLGRVLGKVIPVFAVFSGGLGKTSGPLGTFVGWVKGKVIPAVREVASYIATQAKPVIATLGEVFRTKIQPALQAAAEKFRAVRPAIAAVGSFLLALGKAVFKVSAWILGKLLPPLVRLAGWILGKVIPAVTWLVTGLIRVVGAVARFGSALIRGVSAAAKFASGIKNKIGNAIEVVKSIPGKVKGAVSGAAKWLVNAGKAIIQGLINGIKSMFGKVGSTLKGLTQFIRDHKGPIEKDRVLLTPAGKAIMGGLIKGIESQRGALGKTLGTVTDMVNGTGGQMALAGSYSVSGTPMGGGGGSVASTVAEEVARALEGLEFRISGQDLVAVVRRYDRVRGR